MTMFMLCCLVLCGMYAYWAAAQCSRRRSLASKRADESSMGRYSINVDEKNTAKARGHYLRVHFKNTREVCHTLRGMVSGVVGQEFVCRMLTAWRRQNLDKAIQYLKDVKAHKRIVPFTRYQGGEYCGSWRGCRQVCSWNVQQSAATLRRSSSSRPARSVAGRRRAAPLCWVSSPT
jgi:ribosomal protein L22